MLDAIRAVEGEIRKREEEKAVLEDRRAELSRDLKQVRDRLDTLQAEIDELGTAKTDLGTAVEWKQEQVRLEVERLKEEKAVKDAQVRVDQAIARGDKPNPADVAKVQPVGKQNK